MRRPRCSTSTSTSEQALSRSIFFVHTAADPIVEALLVPDISLAVAERFALKGRRVLVLLTDMTNFADAMKEIAITMEQVPANRGYPGDLYSQLAARYEKAVDFEGAGSITILAVTTMPGDDVTHPVPDNTGYITEGQIVLDRELDRAGIYPPVKVGEYKGIKVKREVKPVEDADVDREVSSLQIYDPSTHPAGRVRFRESCTLRGRVELISAIRML